MNCPFCGSVRHRVVNTRRRGATNGDAILRLLDEDLPSTMTAILRRRKCSECDETWGTAEIAPQRGDYKGRFTMQQRNQIKRLYATGDYTQTQLAEKFGTSQSTISEIINGRLRDRRRRYREAGQ